MKPSDFIRFVMHSFLICFLCVLLTLINSAQCAIDYDDYNYDWLTKKPPATSPPPTKDPTDDDVIVDELESRHAEQVQISGAFSNQRNFQCSTVKPYLHTGEMVSQVSPEDITIMGAMGDSLASGHGLWASSNAEFRGAAFPIGGDASLEDLTTIPNILRQFSKRIDGVSYGMGSTTHLPPEQFNMAQLGAETEDLPAQATELTRRIKRHVTNLKNRWALIFIVTGSEEFCLHCEPPSKSSLRKALGILRKNIPRALVVLLGPVHVASTYRQNINLMRPRCGCLEEMNGQSYRKLFSLWKKSFNEVEDEFNQMNYKTFGVLAISSLAIHSRNPQSLLVKGKPLLNRKGHSYAAKWLWNRLLAGPNYNISQIALSEDSFYCPSAVCPYFRLSQNFHNCSMITEKEWKLSHSEAPTHESAKEARREVMRNNMVSVIAVIVVLCLILVSFIATLIYRHGMKATKGRFDYGVQVDKKEKEETEENT